MSNSNYIYGRSLTLTATLASALSSGLMTTAAEADVPELSAWDHSWETRFAAGYNDNVLLSNTQIERSPFVFAGLDYTASRLPVDGNQFFLLVSGEGTRYLDSAQVDDELLLSTIAQFKRFANDRWQWGLTALHLYQDEVIDASISETNRGTLNYRGHEFMVRPNVRRSLFGQTWIELEGSASRHFLAQPLDDYWTLGSQIKLGWDYGHRSELSLAYGYEDRAYDNRFILNSNGFIQPGQGLRFEEHQATLEWKHNLDERRRWRSATRLTFTSRQDNGSGYFDYARYQASQTFRYVTPSWEGKAQLKVTQYDFAVQTATPTDPTNRAKTFVWLELRGQYKLNKHTSIYAAYELDTASGNISAEEYDANTVSAGLLWNF